MQFIDYVGNYDSNVNCNNMINYYDGQWTINLALSTL